MKTSPYSLLILISSVFLNDYLLYSDWLALMIVFIASPSIIVVCLLRIDLHSPLLFEV